MSVDAGSEPRVHADPSHLHPTCPERNHEGITSLLGHGQDVEIHELDKSGNITQRWLHTPDNEIIPVLAKNRSNNFIFRSMREWRKFLSDAFLPVGFPHSVSEDYFAYQTYDSLQAFFSTITSLLANRALLQGLGVGDANSSATFALFLTILKDAMSRVATIVFAQQFGLRIEPDAKKFRFLADVFNDTAFFLELYSPYFGSWGKIAALTSGEALRALCGVSAGASKAALSVHFAKHDNLAELNAKEASQETAVGLVGLLVGTLLVKHVESHQSVVYLMIVLVFAHLWMNYLGVRSVCMANLNRQRATILFDEYLQTGKVLTPTEVARRENIIFWSSVVRNQDGHSVARIQMAESYSHAMGGRDSRINIAIVDGSMHTQFIWCHNNTRLTPIKILLWQGAEPANAIEAWFMAQETAWLMKKGLGYTGQIDRIFCAEKSRFNAWKNDIMVDDGRDVRMYEKRFCDPDLWEEMAAKGWNLDLQAFETAAPVRLTAHFRAKKDN
ncbi:vitamin B6 photo-protection and homoeostasis-domain-containing protein [Dactylonectria estremocensis]|uniref:Vitamin B6 photo-protection and homoeostasis-domain-containing protein n=1 Tax=Dactylonectria estremocensis TaxID=1079267 RepID=A0A9P9EZ01_9HYPO|nr:vitamin B6 photo-protection and homoeostasis-domain-containing protein [Dactylonectria estremocensis]